jgi:hypothetical protein
MGQSVLRDRRMPFRTADCFDYFTAAYRKGIGLIFPNPAAARETFCVCVASAA